jgi:non-specific serine/threonine protein kinase
VDKSLVVFDAERAACGRYRLLETIRQYAQERLTESQEAAQMRGRHRNYFLALAEEAEPQLMGAEQAVWLQRLAEEHENLRAALDWSLKEKDEFRRMKDEWEGIHPSSFCLHPFEAAALRLCGALQRYWMTRGYLSEGREWCVQALEKAGGQERRQERAKTLNGVGVLAYSQGESASARAYLEESLAIYQEVGDRSGISESLEAFASLNAKERKTEPAAVLWGAAEALREEIGSPLLSNAREQYDRDVAEASGLSGEEAFSTAWAEGRAMPLEQAIEYARVIFAP